jgi:hypothetical protein
MSEQKRVVVQVRDYVCPHCGKLVSHAVVRVGAELQDLILVDGAELECPRTECAKLIGHVSVQPLFPQPKNETEKRKEGWFMPSYSRKFHYFVEGRSLCRGWMLPGELDPDTGNKDPGKEDCITCFRQLQKRRKNLGVEKIE